MAEQRIDNTSLHALVSALTEREHSDWTIWQQNSVAEITMSLLSRDHFSILRPPRVHSSSLGIELVEQATRILEDFVDQPRTKPQSRAKALTRTKSYARNFQSQIRTSFDKFKHDQSFERFVRWIVSNEWVDHVRRLGSLVDEPLFQEVASILNWTPRQSADVKKQAKELRLVKY